MTPVADAKLITPNVDTKDFGVFILHSMDVATLTQINANMTTSMSNGNSVTLPTAWIVDIGGVSLNTCVKMIIIPAKIE